MLGSQEIGDWRNLLFTIQMFLQKKREESRRMWNRGMGQKRDKMVYEGISGQENEMYWDSRGGKRDMEQKWGEEGWNGRESIGGGEIWYY